MNSTRFILHLTALCVSILVATTGYAQKSIAKKTSKSKTKTAATAANETSGQGKFAKMSKNALIASLKQATLEAEKFSAEKDLLQDQVYRSTQKVKKLENVLIAADSTISRLEYSLISFDRQRDSLVGLQNTEMKRYNDLSNAALEQQANVQFETRKGYYAPVEKIIKLKDLKRSSACTKGSIKIAIASVERFENKEEPPATQPFTMTIYEEETKRVVLKDTLQTTINYNKTKQSDYENLYYDGIKTIKLKRPNLKTPLKKQNYIYDISSKGKVLKTQKFTLN